MDTPVNQRFIAYDIERNNIHLFIRAAKQRDYVHLGLLEYIDHDREKQNPCEFVWGVMHWELTGVDLKRMGLPFEPALMPVVIQAASVNLETVLEQERPRNFAPLVVSRPKLFSPTRKAAMRLTGLSARREIANSD